MISRMRQQLGPAGFVVAIIALVAALAGGAYAASGGGLTGKQKKEVEKIAKKVVKQGPVGPQGPAGTNGSNGKDGAAGANGTNGADGEDGTPGTPGTPGEPGPEGSPWTDGGTLPSEATETGAFFMEAGGTEIDYEPISFPIPLARADAEGIEVKTVGTTQTDPDCFGSALQPEAAPGVLCIYSSVLPEDSVEVQPPGLPGAGEGDIGSAGAMLVFFGRTVSNGNPIDAGSFAITAP